MKQTDAALEARKKAKEARLVIVAECYSKGMSYRAIKAEVMSRLKITTYSTQTVSRDIDTLLKEWRKQRVDDTELATELLLERNRQHYQEVREEWERSREDRTKLDTKKKGIPVGFNAKPEEEKAGSPGKIKTILHEEKRTTELGEGDPRYMELMIRLEDQRAKILGLYAPESRVLTGANGEPLIPGGSGIDLTKLTEEDKAELLKLARKVE